MQYLIYATFIFLKVFIKVIKNILVIKNTKTIAAFLFAIGAVVSTVMTKVVVKLDMASACIISAVVNFFACYAAMDTYDKHIKSKQK